MLIISLAILNCSFGQGRVVINEYMPWTLNGCGATAEFVELLNFGPGPVDIGCFILTDGDYSVTIPPNTILLPGQFYVIAGQDEIPVPCANIDSTIKADLNWNACNCSSLPIPTTGDGFFTDGGSGNEQVVLLSPDLEVIDAVVRSFPLETSRRISPNNNSGCGTGDFDLDEIEIKYETLGMSTGRGNSFARRLDGDCGWVKDPQQSASSTNNTSGDVSDVVYEFSYVNAVDCNENHGGVQVYVKRASYDDFFPMNYTLVYDANTDGIFDFDDEYTYGIDETAPDIFISNLPGGRYRLTVESVLGCSLKTFEFQILPCMPALPAQLEYFRHIPSSNKLEWLFTDQTNVSRIFLEKAYANERFITAGSFEKNALSHYYSQIERSGSHFTLFRLKVVLMNGNYFYSPVIDTKTPQSFSLHSTWPNPASDVLNIKLTSATVQKLPYIIYNVTGSVVLKGIFELKQGINSQSLNTSTLAAGIYQFKAGTAVPVSFRFVKH